MAVLGRVIAVDRAACDLADSDALRALVRTVRPDVIVNAAAYTAVDDAETDEARAFAVNAEAPGVLAMQAKALGSLFVHYSTDYVFDGAADRPYVESDAPNPLSAYGRSKLAGEQAVAESGAPAIVLRTSWVAGAHGTNFTRSILKAAAERDRMEVIADCFGAPTTAALVADATAHVVARLWGQGGAEVAPDGVWHLAAAGETSWHGYATEVVRYALARGAALKLKPEGIAAIPASAWPQRARRPANSRLNTDKLRETFDIHLPEWQHGVHYLIDQILS
jgi:dTDP-4-dehydrorhamnose reductase